jgi:peptidyl-prolyl cis-trans isomerase SurA
MNKFSAPASRTRKVNRSSPCFSPLFAALVMTCTLGGLLCGAGLAQAQSAAAPQPVVTRSADFIVAVVNSEPITNHEVLLQRTRMEAQWPAGSTKPALPELTAQALEQLVNEKIQLQSARESGIRIEEDAVDLAEMNIARQNQMDKVQLRAKLEKEGLTVNAFREQLRKQITLTRLREREVEGRVRISDTDIDQFLREQRGAQTAVGIDLNLAMIVVPVPEDSTEAQVTALQDRAETAARRARAGEDFAALVKEYLGDKVPNGGAMGLRPSDRYPTLFVDNTQTLKVGEIAGPIRSGAGFHVLKVLEKRQGEAPPMMVTQTRARHILLRTSPQLTEAAAVNQLTQFKQRIAAGQVTFAALAREFSQDGSAASGGDLGWTGPGQFVPEFEQVMTRLRPGQMSDPLVSRFGVHLIEVTDRRDVPLSTRDQREMARNLLREKKLDEAFTIWQEDLRGRAFVEMRDAPQ